MGGSLGDEGWRVAAAYAACSGVCVDWNTPATYDSHLQQLFSFQSLFIFDKLNNVVLAEL